MKLLITVKNLDMGESLRSRIEERIANGVARLFDGTVKSQVVIEKQRGFFHCECTLNLPTGLSLDAASGVIAGSPTGMMPRKTYTVTAQNTAGSTQFDVTITVVAPVRFACSVSREDSTTGLPITSERGPPRTTSPHSSERRSDSRLPNVRAR